MNIVVVEYALSLQLGRIKARFLAEYYNDQRPKLRQELWPLPILIGMVV